MLMVNSSNQIKQESKSFKVKDDRPNFLLRNDLALKLKPLQVTKKIVTKKTYHLDHEM